jgi:hypothetical protein
MGSYPGRFMPIPLRLLIPATLAVLAAAPVRAQSCWPVGVLLAVRDAEGHRIDPARLDSVTTDDASPAVRRVSAAYAPAVPGDSLTLLQWSIAGCQMKLGTVTLRLGGRSMRLVFDMMIDSERRRRASVFLFEAPPFREGTFRLRWDDAEDGGYREPPLLRDRWIPVAAPAR